MDMKPEVGEPDAGPWQAESLEGLVRALLPAAGQRPNRPWIVAVDGRSGAGKTTLIDRLRARVPDSDVVHTDDMAWHLSFLTGPMNSVPVSSNPCSKARQSITVRQVG